MLLQLPLYDTWRPHLCQFKGDDTLTVWLDSRLIDPARPVTTKAFGKTETFQYQPDLAQFCQSLSRTGDLHLSYDFRIDLNSAPTEQAESADSARSTKDIK